MQLRSWNRLLHFSLSAIQSLYANACAFENGSILTCIWYYWCIRRDYSSLADREYLYSQRQECDKDCHRALNNTYHSRVYLETPRCLRSENARNSSFEHTSVLCCATTACKARLELLYRKLSKHTGSRMTRAIEHLKWPFEEQ